MIFTDRPMFVEMTDADVERYAILLARRASRTMRIIENHKKRNMTEDEVTQYAQAVRDSIIYFNRRDPAHESAMRYRDEMKVRAERLKKRATEMEEKQKMDIVII